MSVSLWIGVRVDLLQGHDVIDGLLHFIRMDAEGGLQQLVRTDGRRNQRGGVNSEARNVSQMCVCEFKVNLIYLVLRVPER